MYPVFAITARLCHYGLTSPCGATKALPMTATNTATAAMTIVVNTACLLLPREPDRAAVPLVLARLMRSRLLPAPPRQL